MDSEQLDRLYREAFARSDFAEAAELLNGFSEEDIRLRLSELGLEDTQNIHQGALDNPRVGSQSSVALLTRTDRELGGDDVVPMAREFRIKLLDSFGVGELLGLSSGLFMLWDFGNKRRALYRYMGVAFSEGVPVSDGGAGDWSEPFTTNRPVQVHDLGGEAGLEQASAVVVGAWHLSLPELAVSVLVPTFFSKGFGIETGKGAFSFVPQSVEDFDGP